MKKAMLFVSLLGVTILVLSAAGFAYAQTEMPEDPADQSPFGFFGRRFTIHHHFGRGSGGGPFHDYMFPAIAEAFGMTKEELKEATRVVVVASILETLTGTSSRIKAFPI